MFSLTPLPLYSKQKEAMNSIEQEAVWAPGPVGTIWGTDFFFLPRIEMLFPRRATHVVVVIPTELSWLRRVKGLLEIVWEIPL